MSLCGEHLSVENMNSAISRIQKEFNVSIPEFTVCGIRSGSLFGHQWYLACDDHADKEKLAEALDRELKILNDDYRTERGHALKELKVEIHPLSAFHAFLAMKGKVGGQSKFPRVMRKEQQSEFESFLSNWNRNHPL